MIDPTINDYSKGKIYMLTSEQTDDIYIGSTKHTLPYRLSAHLTWYNNDYSYMTAFEILQHDDVKIEWLEDWPSTDRCMLEEREGWWIENYDCINRVVPGRNPNPDKYQRGKIYKLESDQTDKIYVGSTTRPLPVRISSHKSDYKRNGPYLTAFEILKYNDVRIVLLQEFPTTSEYFLLAQERKWIETTNCVNKIIPTRTKKEYNLDKKEKLIQQRKIYYKNNIEYYTEKSHEYYENHKEEKAVSNKIHHKKNKDKHNKRHEQYNRDNRETIKQQRKTHALINKETMTAKRNMKVKCDECGAEMNKSSLPHHKKRHQSSSPNIEEKLRQKRAEYIKKNTKLIAAKRNAKVTCGQCGMEMNKSSLPNHTKRHAKITN